MASSISAVLLVANGDGLHARIRKANLHGLLAVGAIGEGAFADQLHADDAQACSARLLDVLDHFSYIARLRGSDIRDRPCARLCGSCGSWRSRATCSRAPGAARASCEPMRRGCVTASRCCISEDSVLPAQAVRGPGGGVLHVEQHDVEVFGLRLLAHVRRSWLCGSASVGGDLRHERVAFARNALERDAEHLVHFTVGFRGLKKADAVIVGVAHQARESILPQLALHSIRYGFRCQRRGASLLRPICPA